MNFNERVWELVRHIPHGKVLSYGRVAKMLGVPRGARAVGWAMHAVGSFPNSAGVPWHRVVNGEGRISTNCADHTAYDQRDCLKAEGVQFDDLNDLKISNFDAILWSPSPLELQHLLAENLD
jgi:methylated-DNA-protein-cysteine methyltransferase-like protein